MDESRQDDIRRAAAGDRAALERLLVAELPALRGYLRLRIGERIRAKESCSDLAQSICREALADLGDFEYRGEAAFRHWLFQRAQRKILRRAEFYGAGMRDAGREIGAESPAHDAQRNGELLEAYANICSPSQVAAGHEEVARIEAAVDELPEAQREAILLHKVVGLSYTEIAEATNRSEGAVRTAVYRGLADLGIRLARSDS